MLSFPPEANTPPSSFAAPCFHARSPALPGQIFWLVAELEAESACCSQATSAVESGDNLMPAAAGLRFPHLPSAQANRETAGGL